MNIYIQLLAEGFILVALIVFLLWVNLKRSIMYGKINVRDASLSNEELENHIKKIAAKDSVSARHSFIHWPFPRMNENYDFIFSLYRSLNDDIQNKHVIPSSAEWLLDNFYIIEEQIKELRLDINKKSYFRLPVLKTGNYKGYTRIFAVLLELISHTDSQISEKSLTDYLNAYQSQNILFIREIWALPLIIKIVFIENMRHLCENIKETQTEWHEADEIFAEWMTYNTADTAAEKYFSDKIIKTITPANPSYVEHLLYHMRRSGRNYAGILRAVDEKLNQMGETLDNIAEREHSLQSVATNSMNNSITSIRLFSSVEWADLLEAVCAVDRIYNEDPDGTYPLMDHFTRGYYRKRTEDLAAKFHVSEIHIAREAIRLAKEAGGSSEADSGRCIRHVGYYLLGKGLKDLEYMQFIYGKRKPRKKESGKTHRMAIYLGSVCFITFILVTIAVQYSLFASVDHPVFYAVAAGLCVLIPASEMAIITVNNIVCKVIKPAVIPRLELKNGVPEELSTFVVIPTLLPDENRVAEILADLESHYLSNREENIYFALIGAFKDSDNPDINNNESIIIAALDGIRGLNLKYSKAETDKFYFFHRLSHFSGTNKKWISWERKRGALIEFNDLILGSPDTSFAYSSSNDPPFSKIKYVITLDSDTILPIGMAKKMIAVMAHPLNKPFIDSKKGIVTEGYGLMQPRIYIDIDSSNASVFSRFFTGQEGIDPYANAISDVYQDLFGEGIYVGKGIYDVKIFQSVLKNALPENTILSHDLIEGSYVRAGLVTDLRLVDSFPSRYNSHSLRLYRWVRGDWQLVPLLFGRHFTCFDKKLPNPLTMLSRWKMFDNLRRSLVPLALTVLIITGFGLLPGSIYFWLSFFILPVILPFIISAIRYLFSGHLRKGTIKRHMRVISGLKASFLQACVILTFMAHQSWLMLKASTVTLTRIFITKRNLLEWVTSADVEKAQKNSLLSYISLMKVSFLISSSVLILTVLNRPQDIIVSFILCILWAASPFVAYYISSDYKIKDPEISEECRLELGQIARKTWRYFEEFANERSHYLPPDNYQEDPPKGIAYRTSPTNIGLGLLAVLAARDFGYIGTYEMTDLIDKAISTVEELEKWNGHLYNWYDLRTLKLLHPGYVSTVDSGNLICYLITLMHGLREYLHKPLADKKFTEGIRDTLYCGGKDGADYYNKTDYLHSLDTDEPFDLILWDRFIWYFADNRIFKDYKNSVWKLKTDHLIQSFRDEIKMFMPWLSVIEKIPFDLRKQVPSDDIADSIKKATELLRYSMPLSDIPVVCGDLIRDVEAIRQTIKHTGEEKYEIIIDWLNELSDSLNESVLNTVQFIDRIELLIERINNLSEATSFLPLYDEKKDLFSIGFDTTENKLSNSYYNLFASEARQVSYVCIARGEIPYLHWFRMGRSLTTIDRYKGLVSWTGTMFEYLMPLLIMKNYKNSLLDETYSFVIKSQKKYSSQKNIPWGFSESGFYTMDASLNYQYKAIGIPWLGLKRGLNEDSVAAPYATMLALMVDPEEAVMNIKALNDDGLSGPYGFYEAADYTPERLVYGARNAIVKSFMAHHQGMSIAALDNFRNGNIMQKRFHSDPEINAARLLLQEKIPVNIVFDKEKLIPFKEPLSREKSSIRRFYLPDIILPKVHILSNGNYSVMVTDKGTGYSKNKKMYVTRWREDRTLDSFGTFFYLRNLDTNAIWSSAYSPLNTVPDLYEVTFTPDKAVFRRTDGDIETKTEIVVAPEDNVEVRRISLKNNSDRSCDIELTSYFEIILAPLAADISHPAFSNLFIETEFLQRKNCIIAKRRPRSDTDSTVWLANTVIPSGSDLPELQYETDRMQLIGRGNTVKNPALVERSRPLTNTVGPVLDPVMSIRTFVKIAPGKSVQLSFISMLSEKYSDLLALTDKYSDPDSVDGAFRLALTRSQMETKYLNLNSAEIELFQNLISHILFVSPTRKFYGSNISDSRKGQPSLWKYSISGDLPIVLVVIKNSEKTEILYEILKAHEYWRVLDLNVDLVILSEEEYSYSLPLHGLISDIVYSRQPHSALKGSGSIYILDRSVMPQEDISLLYSAARLVLDGDGRSIGEQINIAPADIQPKTIQPALKPAEYPQTFVAPDNLECYNGYGGFSANGKEYVIRLDEGQTTPAPWVNVIANPHFGFIVSESGSGYTWFENSRENKLTPCSNDSVSDSSGETLYLCDTDTGSIWTVTSLPVREKEPYIITHGFGYTVFEHESHGIGQKLTQFAAVNDTVKISLLNLKNNTDRLFNLSLTYYIRPVLGVTDQDTSLHITTRSDESGALLIENPYNEEFTGNICFIDCSVLPRTVTGDRKEFFGWGDQTAPDCLLREKLSGRTGIGYDPCGAVRINIAIMPYETADVVFLLGMAADIDTVHNICGRFRDKANADLELNNVRQFWENKVGAVRVKTPDLSADLMLNGWFPYQILSCRIWARSGFYQSGGAYGFRDQLQDSLSLAHISPDITRAQILRHAKHQYTQGDVQHWWHEPQQKGIRTRCSDDRLWLPYVTGEYIRITGDSDILNEDLPYLEDSELVYGEPERYGKPNISAYSSPLYDHCIRAIEISLRFGEHGIPLMGTGDWNDGMNAVGEEGKGESVWLGWFLASVLKIFIPICLKSGDSERAEKYGRIEKELEASLEKYAWDGNWYRRAYFDNGDTLGSAQNDECKIDSIAQSWAVISDAGDKARAAKAMDSLDDYLIFRNSGIIKLFTPPFDKGTAKPGYIKGYLPGVRENGGQYTHAAAWVIVAFAKLGDGERAWQSFDLINPVKLTENVRECLRYKTEPYVSAADVYALHPHTGRGGWSWYTGSAGWIYRAGIEYILGFGKSGDHIVIDPCIPKRWKEYSIDYRFGDTLYMIHVSNPNSVNKGVSAVYIDGENVPGKNIPLINDGVARNIEVIMG